MENISHFLRTCQAPPLSMPPHDMFLTIDLYEGKDPAQVLQCIEGFSRRASVIQAAQFPKAIGGRKASLMSPQGTGTNSNDGQKPYGRNRGVSNASETSSAAGGRTSPFKTGATSPSGGSSSWANRSDMGATAPAWNIAQYGWTGGASQGNQGITFGGRRQITTPAPSVPSLADKERRRREQEAEVERLRIQAEEAEHKRRVEREAEEERQQAEEARRWEEETRKRKEKERKEVEEEKRRWEAEERRWREEEEIRLREEREAETRFEKERQRRRAGSDARLKGQFLSQYQVEQQQTSVESERVKELERQLEEAKERERQYERERQEKLHLDAKQSLPVAPHVEASSTTPEQTPEPHSGEEDSWQASERDFLRREWTENQPPPAQRPLPLPVPKAQVSSTSESKPVSPRPLPDPAAYRPQPLNLNRTDRYLSSNPAPIAPPPATHTPSEANFSSASERAAEDGRRLASQNTTKAGGWASKSLLEREMERERQRQQEWEEEQKQTKEAADKGLKDPAAGTGPGQSWDVNAYGYTGGDNLNKGGGVYSGRRQILGPRPLGSKGA